MPPLTVRSGLEAEPCAAGGGIRARTLRSWLPAVPNAGTNPGADTDVRPDGGRTPESGSINASASGDSVIRGAGQP